MRTSISLFFLFFVFKMSAQQNFSKVFGSVGADINRGYKIVALPDKSFIIGGDWNGQGYLMRLMPNGNQLKYKTLATTLGTTSIKDLVLDATGTTVFAVGECKKCVAGDSTVRVFAVKADTANLSFTGFRVYEGNNAANKIMLTPSIARNGTDLFMSATTAGGGLNFEDYTLTKLNTNLDTVWRKVYNSCGACGFEYAWGTTATPNGVTTVLTHAFTDSATIWHFDLNGNPLWKIRSYTTQGIDNLAIAAKNDKVVIGGGIKGLFYDPTTYTAAIAVLSETTGVQVGAIGISVDTLTHETVTSVDFTNNGSVLVGYKRTEPTRVASRVYRLNPTTYAIAGFTEIPKDDDFTGTFITNAVSLNNDGTEFAACGFQGLNNRTFFFSRNSVRVAAEDVDLDSQLSVFPNPNSGHFQVKIPIFEGFLSLTITNSLGQIVLQQKIPPSVSAHFLPVSVGQKGIYFCQIQSEKGIVVRQVLVN